MPKLILHIDMDCFFAAIEISRNLKLNGKPVVIGADPRNGNGRGVVSTCSMEARKFGIHSAMPITQAYRLCPKAIFLKPHFKIYSKTSKKIMQILKNYSDKFQQVGVDEAYLDITDKVLGWADAKILAYKIKNEIFEKLNLTCSIGLANNKLVAKIASDHNKPDGITIVHNNKKFLKNLPIRKLRGVGKKMEPKLKNLGIKTIGQLASFNKEKLINKFGVYGLYLNLSANGNGSDFVAQEYGRKSIGHERTFFDDLNNLDEIDEVIEKLSQDIHERLLEEHYVYKTISIKIRLHNFDTYTRALTLRYLCNSKEIIIKIAKSLFREFLGSKIRLIGIRVSNLEDFEHQRTLEQYIYV